MQRKFITNLAFLLLLNLLVKPFWLLGVDRAVQNELGAEIYGQYYALFNFSFLLNILLDLGITNFNNRNIAQNRQLLNKHFSGIITLRLLLGVGFVGISMLMGLLIGYGWDEFRLLWILLLNQFLASMILYFRSNISGLLLFRTDSLISVLDRAIMIGICSVLLWGDLTSHSFRIEWFIYAQLVAYSLTAVISFLIVAFRAGLQKLTWNRSFFMMILKKSYPFALLILLMSFYNRIDSVMLERMLTDGKKQAGIYAQAFRLLEASNMIAYLFAGILLPMFSHMLKRKEKVDDLLRLSFSMIGTLSVSAGIISIFFGNQIMELLYTEHTEVSSDVFRLLMVTFFAISSTYIYGTLLTANNNLRELNIMAACAMTMNIILNLILIPRYSVIGAAFASLATQYAAALTQVILGHRILHIKPRPVVILKFVIFSLLATLTCYFTDQLAVSFILKLLLTCFLIFLSAIAIGLLNIKEIIRILRMRSTY